MTIRFTLILLSCIANVVPAFGQFREIYNQAKSKAQATIQSTTTPSRRTYGRPSIGGSGDGTETNKRAYERFSASGNDQAAAQAAFTIASIYDRQENWKDAADWYRKSYSKGGLAGSKGFIDLILRKKITIDNPESIRPFVEYRAGCGSRLARAYVLEHWHETPTQIPDYDYVNHRLSECGPAGPDDREDGHVMTDTQRRQNEQQLADYYRQHPDQDPKVKQQKAEEGGAIVLGALLVMAASMPDTGPGSISCNKYTNHYPGYTDPSVCVGPVPEK